MAQLSMEQVRILFFNDQRDMILDERIWPGAVDEVEVPVCDIVRHALLLGSTSLLFAHNHPSGDCRPSRQDVEYTRSLVNSCKALKIRIYDHIIVSRNGSFSFRDLGYM